MTLTTIPHRQAFPDPLKGGVIIRSQQLRQGIYDIVHRLQGNLTDQYAAFLKVTEGRGKCSSCGVVDLDLARVIIQSARVGDSIIASGERAEEGAARVNLTQINIQSSPHREIPEDVDVPAIDTVTTILFNAELVTDLDEYLSIHGTTYEAFLLWLQERAR